MIIISEKGGIMVNVFSLTIDRVTLGNVINKLSFCISSSYEPMKSEIDI